MQQARALRSQWQINRQRGKSNKNAQWRAFCFPASDNVHAFSSQRFKKKQKKTALDDTNPIGNKMVELAPGH